MPKDRVPGYEEWERVAKQGWSAEEVAPEKKFIKKSWKGNIDAPIDKGIADLIIELNDSGYQTYSSCEGHYKKRWSAGNIVTNKTGFVQFARELDTDEIQDAINIARNHGLSDVRMTTTVIDNPESLDKAFKLEYGTKVSYMTFRALWRT